MNTDDLTLIGEEIDKVLIKLIEMQKERALMIDAVHKAAEIEGGKDNADN